MLVIISDLHLTDGTTCANIGADAFYLLAERLRDMAYRASWRSDGAYRPIERIDLVLLGDIFDYLHSTRWAEGTPGPSAPVRPWDYPHTSEFAQAIQDISEGVLRHNHEACAALKRLSTGEAISVPLDAKAQHSGVSRKRQPVPVRIFYMSGNHDWYFHLSGAPFDAIRSQVIAALGLSNTPEPFPYTLEESPVLAEICRRHSVYARHGDFYDPVNYDKHKGRDAATLGDAIAVGLIDRFPAVVQAEMGSQLSPEFIKNLREIVNVRPSLLVPAWVEGLLQRSCEDPTQRQKVKDIWNGLADQFLKEPFVRSLDKALSLDAVDGLEAVLTLSKVASLETLSKLMTFITEKFWEGNISLSRFALREQAFLDRTARYIVYGHTHHAEAVPLDLYHANDKLVGQVCFNTGTWHALHVVTQRDPRALNFLGYHMMTYLAFFQGDERRGKPFETWSGTLAWD